MAQLRTVKLTIETSGPVDLNDLAGTIAQASRITVELAPSPTAKLLAKAKVAALAPKRRRGRPPKAKPKAPTVTEPPTPGGLKRWKSRYPQMVIETVKQNGHQWQRLNVEATAKAYGISLEDLAKPQKAGSFEAMLRLSRIRQAASAA